MPTQPFSRLRVPHERSWESGASYPLEWELDGTEWIVSCRPECAVAPIFGFGSTVADAVADLDKSYRELHAFATDSSSEWWRQTNR